MAKKRNIYIGVAWPYVNDLFHIGNLAGAYLPPDIFARFHKLQGNNVLMVSGSDFHGTPITLRADAEKKKPEEIAQKYHDLDKKYLKKFNIDYTLFTSTHTPNHKKVTQDMFLKLLEQGYIQIQKTEQLYSEKTKKFLQDRYIEGECPYCHAKDARGDQCEKCGRVLDALELINPVSKVDQSELTKKETENYFLDLTKLSPAVEKWLLAQKDMRSWVKSEALGWIKEGLLPRSITRDIDYGVSLPVSKIPKSQKIANIDKKKFYVWFEATIGYLSAAIEYSKKINKPTYWKNFFYDKDGETYYFVGQDNLVFHAINWPAQLAAFDTKINLPTNVIVNKFLLLEGQKMSKSRNWVIDTEYLAATYPIDAVRFYLSFNMPEAKEMNFTWQEFVDANNSILVGTVGNYIHRVLSLVQKNFGRTFRLSSVSPVVKKEIEKTFKLVAQHLEKAEFRVATQEVVNLAAFGNQYIDKKQLWQLVKDNPKEAKKVAQDLLYIVDSLRILLYPFTPDGAFKLNDLLGYKKKDIESGKDIWALSSVAKTLKFPATITPIFEKIDEKSIKREVEKLQENA